VTRKVCGPSDGSLIGTSRETTNPAAIGGSCGRSEDSALRRTAITTEPGGLNALLSGSESYAEEHDIEPILIERAHCGASRSMGPKGRRRRQDPDIDTGNEVAARSSSMPSSESGEIISECVTPHR
jgi:hypothetical protein